MQEYISAQHPHIQKLLEQVRATIAKAAPGAEEVISYSMPAFRLYGMLVWYAAFKNHIGFYPRGSGIEEFRDELADYKTSKGAVQFPVDKPMPLKLITKMVQFRVKQNKVEAAVKKAAATKKG